MRQCFFHRYDLSQRAVLGPTTLELGPLREEGAAEHLNYHDFAARSWPAAVLTVGSVCLFFCGLRPCVLNRLVSYPAHQPN